MLKIITSLFFKFSQNFSTISHRTHRIIFVTVLSASDVIYAIIHCLENREPQIAVRSHVAGAFSGILMGFIFYESHRIDNGKKDLKFKIIRKTSIATFLCLVMFFILLNVVWYPDVEKLKHFIIKIGYWNKLNFYFYLYIPFCIWFINHYKIIWTLEST